MEGIIRKRHPNSLPVLMWAAASAPDVEMPKLPSVKHLEERVVSLEKEIEEKDEEAKRSLRLLEQKYNSMKVCQNEIYYIKTILLVLGENHSFFFQIFQCIISS